MLKRVSIQNFKSLKDVTLDLQKVNLLIGPNNSGKTNFLKALEYFGKGQTPISTEPDRNKIAYRRNFDDTIKIQFKFDPKNKDYDFKKYDFYIFECKINPNGSVIRSKWYQDLAEPTIETTDANDSSYSYSDLEKKVGPLIIYKPDPNKIDKPGPVGIGAEIINADAANLVGFLDLMLSKYRRTTFNQIETDLHKCVPEFTEINLDDVEMAGLHIEGHPTRSFKRVGLTNPIQDLTFWADELSEGVLYFLALLCIINQPNPPKLLLLEEPEKGIHPRRIHEVVQFILRLSEEKDVQVIMTTHSPIVVDMFKDMPESVFIFDKDEEGATHVKNLQKDIIEPETEESKRLGIEPPHYTSSLGNAWTVGFLGGVPK